MLITISWMIYIYIYIYTACLSIKKFKHSTNNNLFSKLFYKCIFCFQYNSQIIYFVQKKGFVYCRRNLLKYTAVLCRCYSFWTAKLNLASFGGRTNFKIRSVLIIPISHFSLQKYLIFSTLIRIYKRLFRNRFLRVRKIVLF